MALDFTALQTEFFARGFDYLNDGASGLVRAKRWINDAMHEINETCDWPYLNASTTGASPLTISDLRTVESVVDSTSQNLLRPTTRRDLLAQYTPDLTSTGAAEYYYITDGTTVNAFPVSTNTLKVYYWKFGPDLSATTDTPLMPDRFRYAIVDLAVARALRDDESAEAQNARASGDALVERMRQSLMSPQHQGPTFIQSWSIEGG